MRMMMSQQNWVSHDDLKVILHDEKQYPQSRGHNIEQRFQAFPFMTFQICYFTSFAN